MLFLGSLNKTKGLALSDGRYLVVKLDKVEPGHLDESKENMESIINGLANNFGQLDYELYRRSLIKSSKIKLYD